MISRYLKVYCHYITKSTEILKQFGNGFNVYYYFDDRKNVFMNILKNIFLNKCVVSII